MNGPELKPCPFCGGEAEKNGGGVIQCQHCGACIANARQWNKRVPNDVLIEALEDARLSVAADLEAAEDPDGRFQSFRRVFAERLAKIDAALSLARSEGGKG